jgi:hypothetical protein
MVVLRVGDRAVAVEVPVVERPDLVLVVGDEAVHRHHAVHDHRAHRSSSVCVAPILSLRRAVGL